ncbi:MAG: response regulator transcription factor, partial [Sedimenticolaceae bacterium]
MDGVRIIVADDHPLFREGVVRTLAAVDDFEVVAEASDRKTAVELAKELLPDVILMDVSMPGGGINAAADIASSCPVVRIVMLTVAEDEDTV